MWGRGALERERQESSNSRQHSQSRLCLEGLGRHRDGDRSRFHTLWEASRLILNPDPLTIHYFSGLNQDGSQERDPHFRLKSLQHEAEILEHYIFLGKIIRFGHFYLGQRRSFPLNMF